MAFAARMRRISPRFLFPGSSNLRAEKRLRPGRHPARSLLGALPFVLSTLGSGAFAQQASVPDGSAVVTSFSGTMSDAATGAPALDPEGAVARVLDLSAPGFKANGSVWETPPEMFRVLARETGQVFGIAVDTARPANIYLTASSAFGLFRRPDNSGWMEGMWGPAGSPGSVYRLNPENDYRPELFVDLTLDGRANGGAGLGNIAYDARNNQLFVSDLENGMIYRIDAASGTVLDRYDHGFDGRAYYLDSATAEYRFSPVEVFDPASAPRLYDCGEGPAEEAAARFSAQPGCWNIADFRRRVYGLAVQDDPEADAARLYYSVWGSQGFGTPDWTPESDDAKNTVWSIGLDESGGFALDSVRREFELPDFFAAGEDVQAHGASHPVTDIAFSENGVMFLAERGGINGVALLQDDVAVTPRGARVLVYARGEDGLWAPQGRFDIGYDERSDLEPPHLRAGAAGGVALGSGYTQAGRIDPQAPEALAWMTGDALCSDLAPCPTRDGTGQDPRPVTGLQGTPLSAMAETDPPGAYDPYPATGPVTPPAGPDASYMIPLWHSPTLLSAGHVGDIEFYRSPAEPEVVELVPDLAISKSVLAECGPNELCRFRVSVRNAGSTRYAGPLLLADDIGGGLSYRPGASGPFACAGAGSHVACYDAEVMLEPGQRVELDLSFLAPRGITTTPVRNCVAIEWLGNGGRDQLRAVQLELAARGFNPGPADGIMGPNTRGAIRLAERFFGLPETGALSNALLTALFGPEGLRTRDAVLTNNRACVYVDIDIPPRPPHWVQLSAFHRRFVSSMHDTRTSGPIEVHDRAISAFHLRYRSSMHNAATTRPTPYHRPSISVFHRTWLSSRHNPRTTRELPIHNTALSVFHLTLGSGLHNAITSLRIPEHRTRLSAFHRTHRSRQHDPRTTWEREVHRTAISVFHRTRRSEFHDPRTTREREIHRAVISTFHRTRRSEFHDPRTTREREIHNPALSTFHRTHQSAQHDPATTRQRSTHASALSKFHRTHNSNQHNPATSVEGAPEHTPELSKFHRTHNSNQHDPTTTFQRPFED